MSSLKAFIGAIFVTHIVTLSLFLVTFRKTAADSIAEMAEATIGSITQFKWDLAVTRIGQLASEMSVSMGGQSVGGSNGNADELTNWDGTKKRGLGV